MVCGDSIPLQFLERKHHLKKRTYVSLSASSGLFMKFATKSVVLGRASLSSEDKSALQRIWVFAHFVYGSPCIRFVMNLWVSEHGFYRQLVSSWSPEVIWLRILCSDWIGVSRVSKLGSRFVWHRKIVLWRLGAIGYWSVTDVTLLPWSPLFLPPLIHCVCRQTDRQTEKIDRHSF